MKFRDFEWFTIARLLGGSARRVTAAEVEIAVGTARYRIQDLKGDLVISVITPIAPHVSYDDMMTDAITEQTLAYRIGQAINKVPIDYTLYLGPVVEEDDEEDDDAES